MVVARTVVSWQLLSAEDVVSEGKALPKTTLFWYYNRIDRAPIFSGGTDLQLEIQVIVDGSDNLISKDSHWIIHEPGIEIIYKQCDICMSTLVLQLKSIFMKNPTFDRLVFSFVMIQNGNPADSVHCSF